MVVVRTALGVLETNLQGKVVFRTGLLKQTNRSPTILFLDAEALEDGAWDSLGVLRIPVHGGVTFKCFVRDLLTPDRDFDAPVHPKSKVECSALGLRVESTGSTCR